MELEGLPNADGSCSNKSALDITTQDDNISRGGSSSSSSRARSQGSIHTIRRNHRGNASRSSGSSQGPLKTVAKSACLATKHFISTLHQLKADIPGLPLKLLQSRLERLGKAAELALQQQQEYMQLQNGSASSLLGSAASGAAADDSNSSWEPLSEHQKECWGCKQQEQQELVKDGSTAEPDTEYVSQLPWAAVYEPLAGKLCWCIAWVVSRSGTLPPELTQAAERLQAAEREPAAVGRYYEQQQNWCSTRGGAHGGAVAEHLAWLLLLYRARELRELLAEWVETIAVSVQSKIAEQDIQQQLRAEQSGLKQQRQHENPPNSYKQQQQDRSHQPQSLVLSGDDPLQSELGNHQHDQGSSAGEHVGCSAGGAVTEDASAVAGESAGGAGCCSSGQAEDGIAWLLGADRKYIHYFIGGVQDLIRRLFINEQRCEEAGVAEQFHKHQETYFSWWEEKVLECFSELLTRPHAEQDQEGFAAADTAAASAAAGAGAGAVGTSGGGYFGSSVASVAAWLLEVGVKLWSRRAAAKIYVLAHSLEFYKLGAMGAAGMSMKILGALHRSLQLAANAGDGRGGLWEGPGWKMDSKDRLVCVDRAVAKFFLHLQAANLLQNRCATVVDGTEEGMVLGTDAGMARDIQAAACLHEQRDHWLESFEDEECLQGTPPLVAMKHWQLQEQSAASAAAAGAGAAANVPAAVGGTPAASLGVWDPSKDPQFLDACNAFQALLHKQTQLLLGVMFRYLPKVDALAVQGRPGGMGNKEQSNSGGRARVAQQQEQQRDKEQACQLLARGTTLPASNMISSSSACTAGTGSVSKGAGGPVGASSSGSSSLSSGRCSSSISSIETTTSSIAVPSSSCSSRSSNTSSITTTSSSTAKYSSNRTGGSSSAAACEGTFLNGYGVGGLAWGLQQTQELAAHGLQHLASNLLRLMLDIYRANGEALQGDGGQKGWSLGEGEDSACSKLARGAAHVLQAGMLLGAVESYPALQVLQRLTELAEEAADMKLGPGSVRRLEQRLVSMLQQLEELHVAGKCNIAQQMHRWTCVVCKQRGKQRAGRLGEVDLLVSYVVGTLQLLQEPGFAQSAQPFLDWGVKLSPDLLGLVADLAAAASGGAVNPLLPSPPPPAAATTAAVASTAAAQGAAVAVATGSLSTSSAECPSVDATTAALGQGPQRPALGEATPSPLTLAPASDSCLRLEGAAAVAPAGDSSDRSSASAACRGFPKEELDRLTKHLGLVEASPGVFVKPAVSQSLRPASVSASVPAAAAAGASESSLAVVNASSGALGEGLSIALPAAAAFFSAGSPGRIVIAGISAAEPSTAPNEAKDAGHSASHEGSAAVGQNSSDAEESLATVSPVEHSSCESARVAAHVATVAKCMGMVEVAPGEYVKLLGVPVQQLQQQQDLQLQQQEAASGAAACLVPPPSSPLPSPSLYASSLSTSRPPAFSPAAASCVNMSAGAAASAYSNCQALPLCEGEGSSLQAAGAVEELHSAGGTASGSKSGCSEAAALQSAAALAEGLLGVWSAVQPLKQQLHAVQSLSKGAEAEARNVEAFRDKLEAFQENITNGKPSTQQSAIGAALVMNGAVAQDRCTFASTAAERARRELRQGLAGLAYARQQVRGVLGTRCNEAYPASSKLWEVESPIYIHSSCESSYSSSSGAGAQLQWLEGLEEDLNSREGVGGVAGVVWLGPAEGVFRDEGIACKVVPGPLGAALPVLLLQGLAAKDPSHLPERMRRDAAGRDADEASTECEYFDSEYDQIMQEEVQLGLQQQEACLFAALQLLLKVRLLEETWAVADSRESFGSNSSSDSSSSQGDRSTSFSGSRQPCRRRGSQNSSSSSSGSSDAPEVPAAAASPGRLQQSKQQEEASGLAGLKEVLLGILNMPAEGQLQVCAGGSYAGHS